VKIGKYKFLSDMTSRHCQIECGHRKIDPKNSSPQRARQAPAHATFATTQIENKRTSLGYGACQTPGKFGGLAVRSEGSRMPVSSMRFCNGTAIEARDVGKPGPSVKCEVEVGRRWAASNHHQNSAGQPLRA
jgi:hypothetical protein